MNFRLALNALFATLLFCMPSAAQEAATDDQAATEDATAEVSEFSGDFESGEKLYKKECRGCHGPTAKGLASYPKLRGHPADYLVDKLTRYRAGEKFGPNTPLMAPRAKKLSDADITNIVFFIVTKFPD